MSSSLRDILNRATLAEVDLQPVTCVAPHTAFGEVLRILDERSSTAVLICEEEEVRGIFTQRDILYRTALEGFAAETPIAELMTPSPRSIGRDRLLGEALDGMIEGGHRQLPVVDDGGRPLGLLTSRRILTFVASHFPHAVLNLPPRLHQVHTTPWGG